MSAKKARKSRPKREPAPTIKPERVRSVQPRGKAAASSRGKTRYVGGKALSPLEVQLRKTLAEMGLARARRVFAAIEASFDD